jgi:acetyltransferase-like isoleucine patch superfamily enzyme
MVANIYTRLHLKMQRWRNWKTMKKILSIIVQSSFAGAFITFMTYLLYAAVLGVSLFPSLYLVVTLWKVTGPHDTPFSIFIVALSCGVALMLFFVSGVFIIGAVIRFFSAGIKPGSYPVISFTMFRWLLYSGLYNLAGHLILEFIPMSFLHTFFFRLMGAKIGKNVRINTWFLNDAYLLEIGDNIIIGGKTDISCHTFERGHLVLNRIKIGSQTTIGQGCYISPGVTIGEKCVIGQYVFVRKNIEVPSGTILSAIAGLPVRTVSKIEKTGELDTDAA